MPELDVQRLLDATKRRSRQLRTKHRLFAGGIAVALAAAIAIPAAALSAGSGREGVTVSPGPAEPTLSTKPTPPSPPPTLPAIVAVPNVVGLSYESAVYEAGLLSDFYPEHSPTLPAGTVISQIPAAGSKVPSGSIVRLAVSIGPAPPAGTPPCQAANLKVQYGPGGSEETGQNTTDLSFINLGKPCLLDGYPSISALDTQGRALGFIYSHYGDQETTDATPRPLYLPRGTSAWIQLNKYRCDIASEDTTASFKFTMPSGGGTLKVPVAGGFDYCREAPSLTITVSPFEPLEMMVSASTAASPPSGCDEPLTVGNDGTVAPLDCSNGQPNDPALQYYEGGNSGGWYPTMLQLPISASRAQVVASLCHDIAPGQPSPSGVQTEQQAYQLAAQLNGWQYDINVTNDDSACG